MIQFATLAFDLCSLRSPTAVRGAGIEDNFMSQKKTHRTRRPKSQPKQLRPFQKDSQYREFVETYQDLYTTRYSSTSNLIAAGLATALVLE